VDSPDSVKVRIGISGSVVVDDDVDSLDINSTTEDVGGDQNSLLERLELLVSSDSLFLGKTRVDRDRREVALAEESVEFGSAGDGFHEDADLARDRNVSDRSEEKEQRWSVLG
jgi:hypothetical protein